MLARSLGHIFRAQRVLKFSIATSDANITFKIGGTLFETRIIIIHMYSLLI
jgi:hypothetical protein